MVDSEKLRELARRRGMTESATVRQTIEYALAADDALDALRELHEQDGADDIFHRLPDEAEE